MVIGGLKSGHYDEHNEDFIDRVSHSRCTRTVKPIDRWVVRVDEGGGSQKAFFPFCIKNRGKLGITHSCSSLMMRLAIVHWLV